MGRGRGLESLHGEEVGRGSTTSSRKGVEGLSDGDSEDNLSRALSSPLLFRGTRHGPRVDHDLTKTEGEGWGLGQSLRHSANNDKRRIPIPLTPSLSPPPDWRQSGRIGPGTRPSPPRPKTTEPDTRYRKQGDSYPYPPSGKGFPERGGSFTKRTTDGPWTESSVGDSVRLRAPVSRRPDSGRRRNTL